MSPPAASGLGAHPGGGIHEGLHYLVKGLPFLDLLRLPLSYGLLSRRTCLKTLLKRILPSFGWNLLRQSRLFLTLGFQTSLELVGYTVARKNDYYSPLPTKSHLRAHLGRWCRPSALQGIDFDIDAMESELSSLLLRYLQEFSAVPAYEELIRVGYGPGYTKLDALTLYMMIRDLKPRRYIEVGSGLSTYYCGLAAGKNAGDGHPVHITCIEPYPKEKLYSIPGIEVISKEVQDTEISFFQQLEENDVLFIDSSHILRIDGDVPFLFLEVLPALNAGVVIHVHDAPFPYNFPYPPQHWIFGQIWPVFWNEAMVLQAFLCFNTKFKIMMSTPLIRHFDEAFLQNNVPIYESIEQNHNTFSSNGCCLMTILSAPNIILSVYSNLFCNSLKLIKLHVNIIFIHIDSLSN
jgi:predicted O-methyltransferase YrrM